MTHSRFQTNPFDFDEIYKLVLYWRIMSLNIRMFRYLSRLPVQVSLITTKNLFGSLQLYRPSISVRKSTDVTISLIKQLWIGSSETFGG